MTLSVMRVAASVSPLDGGPATGILALSRELRLAGTEDTIYATDAHGAGHLRKTDLPSTNQPHVNLSRVHSPRALKPALGMSIRILLGIRHVDVVHIHGFYLFHSALAAVTARLMKKPYIIQPHGVFEPYQEKRSRGRKNAYMRVIGDQVLRHAAGLIFATEAEQANAKAVIERYSLTSWIMPLGADATAVPPNPPGTPHEPTVLFLARLASKKRVDLAIKAMPIVLESQPRARLLIAGEGDMELVETPLAELAPEVQERISVIGFVEGDAKAAAFAQADAYVLASENENFGISVAEALATATPVIISDQVAIAPAVETSEAGIIVSSLTPEAVADAILRVLDPDTNQVMSQHAKELANREFSWSATARTAEGIYRDLLPPS